MNFSLFLDATAAFSSVLHQSCSILVGLQGNKKGLLALLWQVVGGFLLAAISVASLAFGQEPAFFEGKKSKPVAPPAELAYAWPLPNRDDATLRGVTFVDPDRGWAVGDLGVILHTTDGGDTWSHQLSGTTHTLSSVIFLNAERGFAAGGWYEADTGLSRGVLLETRNGGKNWTPILADLPWIRTLRVASEGGLVASGDWSPAYNSRAFLSGDLGKSWQSIEHADAASVKGVQLNGASLAMFNHQGTLYEVPYRDSKTSVLVNAPGTELLLFEGSTVVARRADGGVLYTRDRGRNWLSVNVNDLAVTGCAMLVNGDLCLYGLPGNSVLRIDGQGTVERSTVESSLPLHSMQFVDQHRGWAVGALGQVVATRDGGRTWRALRGGEKRAMVLAVAQKPHAIPWIVLASESLEQGRRIAVAIAAEPMQELPEIEQHDPLIGSWWQRTLHACGLIGGAETVLWTSSSENLSGQETSLQQSLSALRPLVLVLGSDLTDAQREAWLKSAAQLGVMRVFDVAQANRGELNYHSSAVLPVSGTIAGDHWKRAMEPLNSRFLIPERTYLRRRWDQSPDSRVPAFVSESIANTQATRPISDGRRRNIQVLSARSGEQAMVDRLMRQLSSVDDAALELNIKALVKQTPIENQTRLLRLLLNRASVAEEAERDTAAHRFRLYLMLLRQIPLLVPETSLARFATLRSRSIEKSSEWTKMRLHAAERPYGGADAGQVAVASHRSPFETTEPQMPNDAAMGSSNPLQQASGNLKASPPSTSQVIQPVSYTENQGFRQRFEDLPWESHPLNVLRPQADSNGAIDPMTLSIRERFGRSPSSGVWGVLMQDSLPGIIANNSTGHATKRPRLDGILTDPCWASPNQAFFEPNRTPNNPAVQHIQFAYDDQYLYIAAIVEVSGDYQTTIPATRVRDDWLADQPRLLIELDVDRDLTTHYQLMVDIQGRTSDACDNFTLWQPRWFVATRFSNGKRIVELAIDQTDLVNTPLTSGDKWLARVRTLQKNESLDQQAGIVDPCGWSKVQF